jgi:lipopolysaccharide/colanic/teichoic acid biosynthesis glycosyltransferase
MAPSATRSPEDWAALDFSYIDHWSLALDFKILARTVPAMLKRF